MVVAEGQKIFCVQCIWERIFVSLKKIFVFKYYQLYFILFLREIYMEKVSRELFWAHFFGRIFFRRPYCLNGTKIHLDAALSPSINFLKFQGEFEDDPQSICLRTLLK